MAYITRMLRSTGLHVTAYNANESKPCVVVDTSLVRVTPDCY